MKNYTVFGSILCRETFSIYIEAENEDEARIEARDLWRDGHKITYLTLLVRKKKENLILMK